ncbi:hypothetical protein GCM10010415_69060 [Streptomyces atrovirens]
MTGGRTARRAVVEEPPRGTLRPVARREGTPQAVRDGACAHWFSAGPMRRRREVYRMEDDAYHVETAGGPGARRLRHRLAERVRSADGP